MYAIPGPRYFGLNSTVSLDMLYGLVNLMFDPVPNLVFGLEYNYGYKRSTHEGTIATPQGVVEKIDESRNAHRISFGVFFDF